MSSLGFILDTHDQPALVRPWLAYLPLRGPDRKESRRVWLHLLRITQAKPELVVGERLVNAPWLIRAIISYLQLPKVADEEEVLTSRQIVLQLRQRLLQVAGLEDSVLAQIDDEDVVQAYKTLGGDAAAVVKQASSEK